MKVYILQLGDMGNCTYIVEHKKQGLIIDPSWDMQAIEKILTKEDITPKAALFTHGHYDHVTDAKDLLEKYRIKGYIHYDDLDASNLPHKDMITFEADHSETLAGLKVDFLSTPGHSKGSVCIKIGNLIFTGDTLFPNACGRTDLPGGNPRDLMLSLKKLAKLPDNTVIYSGHAYGADGTGSTTIGQEKANNPFLKMALREPENFEDMI